ncbi:MAG TPA: hypothetical protein DCS44_06345 [Cyanobacteria bacterium UBA10660]|nr:MAG TPA: hypothetical protein CPT83_01100 [Candidatus Gastranaerophilales bacterium HUM_1]HAS94216.1 hypothetical protein [Cyanobacteria bacterium UBA10660]
MLLSPASIDKLTNIITGYSGLTSKINKSEIDKILETSGSKDIICTYDECFVEHTDIINNPLYARKEFKQEKYVKLQLEKLNGTSKIADFITVYFEHIYDYTDEPEEVVEYLNRYFDDDGYSVEKIEELDEYRIYSIDDCLVNYDCLFKESERGNYILINEHNEKCFNKIKSGDYTGAITNSRSLLEQILREIQIDFLVRAGRRRNGYNGKIDVLLNDVLNKMNIKDGLQDKIYQGYTSLEEGFKSLVHGVSLVRHGMSDAHNITYVPSEKDALLIVNTAKTLANFIVRHYFEHYVNAA